MFNLFRQNIFFTVLLLISFLIAIFYFLYSCFSLSSGAVVCGVVFFIPPFLIFLSFSLLLLNSNNILKLLLAILHLVIIVFVQLFIGTFLLILYDIGDKGTPCKNISKYEEVLQDIGWQTRVAHFPREIPNEAINAKMFKQGSAWFGSTEFILIFSAPRNYIEREIKKYKYISIEKPTEYIHDFKLLPTNSEQINYDDFTFYVIGDKESENTSADSRYHRGIGINDTKDKIVYYYVNPD